MPLLVPRLDVEFRREAMRAVGLARSAERIRSAPDAGATVRAELHPARMDTFYEIAYLKAFVHWEAFLDAVFLRCLCGRATRHGASTVAGGSFATITAASLAVAGGGYLLWHNPQKVVARCAKYLPGSSLETVIKSAQTRLEYFGNVRHRIAHLHDDSRAKFDHASMQLAGRRYKGGRAGTFLRDWEPGTFPRRRWIEAIAEELSDLAAQIT